MRIQSATATITHAVTVAAGLFAPGHVGELTQYLPFELVDDVLEQTRTVQRRLRALPSRAGVYFVLALGMFPRPGYLRVRGKLTAGLAGLGLPCPSEKALRDLRRRLGPAPLKALFEVVAGPLAQPHAPGVRFAGLRTVAFDGLNSLKVPGTGRNRGWLGKIRHRLGMAGYPALRVMALAETGTRGLLGATAGSVSERDEVRLARRLLPLLGPGMLILPGRASGAAAFLAEITATGAMLLVRARSTRKPPVLAHLPDGSCLSNLDGGLAVRIIEAGVVMTGADGTRVAGSCRLITTLTGHRRYPAGALVRLCHERREIESAYLALRHTLLDGRVLRSGDRPGAGQELWAMLTLCQLLRMAMVTAVETRPGANPGRASFTTALEAAREELTAARGICPAAPADLPGVIGRAVLPTLLPARRPRYSARKVKCATSRYLARDDGRPRAVTAITAIRITVTTPPLDPPGGRPRPRAHRKNPARTGPQPPTRRQRVTALMTADPHRDRSGRELAGRLQITPRNLHTQLGEWAKLGFITRTGFATYALSTPPADTALTIAPDP